MWVRFDDQYPIHRKVAPLDDATFRLACEAVFWCSRNMTDGRIAVDEFRSISRRATKSRAFSLISRGIWHESGFLCASEFCPPSGPDGWVIHDFLEYQWSKERQVAERDKAAKRQQTWRDRHRDDAVSNGVSNGVTNAVTNGAPTRPVPKGRGGTGNDQGDSSVTRARPEPPRKCEEHINTDDAPPCGRCADLRRRHDSWQLAEATRRREAPKCERHRGQPASNCAMCRSEALAVDEPSTNGRHAAFEEQTQLLPFLRAVPNQESA